MPVAEAALGGEAVRVEAAGQIDLVREPLRDLAEGAEPGLAPGRGNHQRVDVGPVDTVEGRRLVIHVDDPDRHDDEAGAQVEVPREETVEVGLLDLELPLVVRRRDGVLDLQLRIETDPLVEVVADEQNQAAQIDDRRPDGRRVQRQLAVAADGGRGCPTSAAAAGSRWRSRAATSSAACPARREAR